jgi:hypothetical protein
MGQVSTLSGGRSILTGIWRIITKLSECMERNEDGSLRMTISMPEEAFVHHMAKSLAQMVSAGQ